MKACPNCAAENAEGAKFCSECGSSLASRGARVGEERKVVSILFCDLVGFTARSDRADPEDVRAAIRPYHVMLRKEIEAFGGTVEKFIGDAVMAVFGAPVAHEDDAERAVRAGLRILEAIEQMNQAEASLGLSVRIGINTGEALVSLDARPEHGEGMVTGDVVNTASRLQTVAPAGAVVVGEQTYRTTARVFEYVALPPAQVKGKSEPLLIWRPTAARARFGVDVERAGSAAFIGRDDELELLKRTYGRCVRESSVQLVTVTGEPGVGKSRLVAEFFRFIDEQPELVSWRQGRCLPYGDGITFWALGEIIKAQTGILESDSLEEARTKLTDAVDAFVEDRSDRQWILTQTAPLVGLPVSQGAAEVERTESFTAWRRLLEAIAARDCLVLVFEDMHWADDALLGFLEHLVDWSTGVPMLVVCTARPELFENRSGWGGGKRNSSTISLGPLTEDETARLVTHLLARAVLPAATQSLVLERAGGNPLYAEEFVRMLKDQGILGREGELSGGRAEIPVPESVQALIAARLDTLTGDKKTLLQDASVVGKVFWNGAVAAIGDRGERDVRESLHMLASKELVRPMRMSSVQDEAEWAFWHALVRDVAYEQIPRAARMEKHRAAAAWIEGLAGERVKDHAEVLAHHYIEAIAIAEAAGTTDELPELREKARGFLVMAGDRAMNLDAGSAGSYYRKALELIEAGDPERARALLGVAGAAYLEGRIDDAIRDYREAIREFEERGDAINAARARIKLATPLGHTEGSVMQYQVLLEAIEILEGERALSDLALGYAEGAYALGIAGRPDESRVMADKALAMSETLPTSEAAITALAARGSSRFDLGDIDGIEDMKRSLAIAMERGTAADVYRAQANLGEMLWLVGGAEDGLDQYQETTEFARRRGLSTNEMSAELYALELLFEQGRWDEVLDRGSGLEDWWSAREVGWAVAFAQMLRARILHFRGQGSRAAELMRGALIVARELGEPLTLVPAFTISALTAIAEGRPRLAAELMEEVVRETRQLRGARSYLMTFLPDVVRACAASGELGLAKQAFEGWEVSSIPRFAYAVSTAQAILAEVRGESEKASLLYADVAEHWARYGNVVEQAQCSLGAGRCLVQLGGPEAVEWLRRAQDIFARLGARPLLDEADDLLERIAVGGS